MASADPGSGPGKGGTRRTRPKQALLWRESNYGLLTNERRAEFLQRAEVHQMCDAFSPQVVKQALR